MSTTTMSVCTFSGTPWPWREIFWLATLKALQKLSLHRWTQNFHYANQARAQVSAWSVKPTCCFSCAGTTHRKLCLHELWTRRVSMGARPQLLHCEPPHLYLGFQGDRDNEYQGRNPDQRRDEVVAVRRRPSGGHHVVHLHNQDESRQSHRLREGCIFANLSMMIVGL